MIIVIHALIKYNNNTNGNNNNDYNVNLNNKRGYGDINNNYIGKISMIS